MLAGLRSDGQRRAIFARADVAGQNATRLPSTGLVATEVAARVEHLTDPARALTEAAPVGAPLRGATLPGVRSPVRNRAGAVGRARILRLAGQARRGGYGRVPAQLRDAAATIDLLDPDQAAALFGSPMLRFLVGSDRPGRGGQDRHLRCDALAWQQAGYRVIGLAPSARAASELAAATGGRTDTQAKWLHHQTRLDQLRPAERAWTCLDDRTVLIRDEASMASTLDLDTLTRLAAQAASKVVLVGDPSQIGVINGPGGRLASPGPRRARHRARPDPPVHRRLGTPSHGPRTL